MAQADPGRSPASQSMGVGSAHDGPGTATRSPHNQYWSLIIKSFLTSGVAGLFGGNSRAPRPGGPGPFVLRDQGASGRPRQGGCSKLLGSPPLPDPPGPPGPPGPIRPPLFVPSPPFSGPRPCPTGPASGPLSYLRDLAGTLDSRIQPASKF